jgi:hypothetical protein
MKQQRSKLGIQIQHPSRDLSKVCLTLGLKPKIVWKKGEERRTPKGNKIGGIRNFSHCSIDFKFPARQPLHEKIVAILARLKPYRTMLRKLWSTGGTISLYIGWFCDADTGLPLDTQILSVMADLRVSVELFVYIPENSIKSHT